MVEGGTVGDDEVNGIWVDPGRADAAAGGGDGGVGRAALALEHVCRERHSQQFEIHLNSRIIRKKTIKTRKANKVGNKWGL